VFDSIIWGLVQGLTEFLPISSSGHLVLVPALLAEVGIDIGEPSLAVSAVLHLGTLLAVLVFYRSDLARLANVRNDPRARKTLRLLLIGTIPAVVGLPLRSGLETIEETPSLVAMALLVTGVILVVAERLPRGTSTLEQATTPDAVWVGLAQAFALIPGISRSGSTITMATARGFDRTEAARFSFLLAVPTIAGAGLLSLLDLNGGDGSAGAIFAGFIVAALSGYAAIAVLLRLITTRGFLPFAIYCFVVGTIAVIVL
jgi:undecaprenyl-diphosphatase